MLCYMASLSSTILLQIQAAVSGGAAVNALTGSVTGLASAVTGLGASIYTIQEVGQALTMVKDTVVGFTDAANNARTATLVFNNTVEKFGVSAEGANTAAQRLADRFGLTVTEVQDNMTTLIRAGFRDMDSLEYVMTGAAASAIAAGKTAQQGFGAIAEATVTGMSQVLNGIGVAQNVSTYLEKMADSLGVSTEALTAEQRAMAVNNLIYDATAVEIEALTLIQNDYVKSQQAVSKANTLASQSFGRLLEPVVVSMNRTWAEHVLFLTQVSETYQKGGNVVEAVAKKYPALGEVLKQIQAQFNSSKPVFDKFATTATEAWAKIESFGRNSFMPFINQIAPLFAKAAEMGGRALTNLAEIVGEVFETMEDGWRYIGKPMFDAIYPAIRDAVEMAGPILDNLAEAFLDIIGVIRAIITGDWPSVVNLLDEAILNVLEAIRDTLGSLGMIFVDALTHINTLIDNKAEEMEQKAKDWGLSVVLGFQAGLANFVSDVARSLNEKLEAVVGGLPDWAKRFLGITNLQEAVQNASQTADGIVVQANAQLGTHEANVAGRTDASLQARLAKATEEASKLDPSSFNMALWQQAFQATGDRNADMIVDYCAQWIREVFGDALPDAREAVNKLFKGNTPPGQTTAVTYEQQLAKRGLTNKYRTVSDLKPGDSVFYVDNGQNHVGVYIGDGLVRGNNRVTYQENGGPVDANGRPTDFSGKYNPVGIVDINKLGRVTSYVRPEDIAAAVGMAGVKNTQWNIASVPTSGGNARPPGGAPSDLPDGKYLNPTPAPRVPISAAQLAKAQLLLNELKKYEDLRAKGDKSLETANAYGNIQARIERFSKGAVGAAEAIKYLQGTMKDGAKTNKEYFATAKDMADFGPRARELADMLEKASTSTDPNFINRTKAEVASFRSNQKKNAVLDTVLEVRAVNEARAEAESAGNQQLIRMAKDKNATIARNALEDMRRAQDRALQENAKDVVKRAAIVRQMGPQILAAEFALNKRIKDAADTAAQQAFNDRAKDKRISAAQNQKILDAELAANRAAEKRANQLAIEDQKDVERAATKEVLDLRRTREREQIRIRRETAATERRITLDTARENLNRTKILAAEELDAFKGTAQQRVALITRQATDIFNAQKRVNQITQQNAERDIRNALPSNATAAQKAAAERQIALTKQTQANADLAAKAAMDSAIRGTSDFLAAESAQIKQFQSRQAKSELDRIKDSGAEQLKAFKGTADERRKIMDQLASDIYDAEMKVATANKAAADAQARATIKDPNALTRALAGNQSDFDAASRTALSNRNQLQRDGIKAIEDEQKAVSNLVNKYDNLQETMEKKILAGTVTADELEDYARTLASYWDEAGRAGIKARTEIGAAHAAARAFIPIGEAALARGFEERISADQVQNVTKAGIAASDALAAVGDKRGALDALNNSLLELTTLVGDGEGVVNAAEQIGELTDRINALEASLKFDSDALAFIEGLGTSVADQISGSLAALASKDVPADMKTKVREFLGTLTSDPQSMVSMGRNMIQGLIDSIGKDPAQAALKRALQQAMILVNDQESVNLNYELLDVLDDTIDDLDSSSAEYGDTLKQVLLPALQDILKTATDPGVRQATQDRIDAINAEIGAVEKLRQLRNEGKLNTLDRSRETGAISEGDYITQRAEELTRQENERFRLASDKKTGAELEALRAEHKANIGKIEADSTRATAALTERIRRQNEQTAHAAEERALELRYSQGLVNYTDYLNQRTELAVKAARAEFDAQHLNTNKESPEYRAALLAFEGQAAGIRQSGAIELTQGLTEAQRQLREASKELYRELGNADIPYETQIQALEELRKKFPQMAAEIDLVIEAFQRLQKETLNKNYLNELTEGFEKIGNSLGGVLKSLGADGLGSIVANLGSVFKVGVGIRNSFTAIGPAFQKSFAAGLGAVGGFVGAIGMGIDLAMQIGDVIEANNGHIKAWKKGLLEVAEAEKEVAAKSVGMFKNPYSKSLLADIEAREQLANSKWWQRLIWGIFGGGPQTMSDEAAKVQIAAAKTFGELAGDLSGALDSALMNAFQSGDWAAADKALTKSLDDFVVKAAMRAVIESSKINDIIKSYSDAKAAGRDGKDELANLRNEVKRVTDEFKSVVTDLPRSAAETVESTWKATLQSAARSILNGDSPLTAVYKDIRTRIEESIVNGFAVKHAMKALQPFLDQLDAALVAGTDPTQALNSLMGQIPGVTAQLEMNLGPILQLINSVLPKALTENTQSNRENTAALREAQFQNTTVVSYANTGNSGRIRQRLGEF